MLQAAEIPGKDLTIIEVEKAESVESGDTNGSDSDARSASSSPTDYGENDSEIVDNRLLQHPNNLRRVRFTFTRMVEDSFDSSSDGMSWASCAEIP